MPLVRQACAEHAKARHEWIRYRKLETTGLRPAARDDRNLSIAAMLLQTSPAPTPSPGR
jgi:hypothetical protein